MKFIILILLTYLTSALPAQQTSSVQATLLVKEFVFDAAPFASCHASTLVALPAGNIMAAWFAGPHEGHKEVGIWMSIRAGNRWDKPRQVADGIINDTLRYPCWNPVLFRTGKGRTFLFYKVGKSPREWWGVVKHSDDNGKTWSAAKKLPDGYLGPIKNKPVALKDGSLLFPSSTESIDNKSWTIHLEKSDAKLKRWQKIAIDCDTFGVIQPSILFHGKNRLQLLCRSRQNYIVESWSADDGLTWGPLKKTSLANPNSGSDAVTLSNGMQLLVYNPLTAGREWWLGRNILKVAISADGREWKDIYTLEEHSSGEYSYPAVIQTPDRLVHITYTDKRTKIRYVTLKLN
jgi:predicted neuraminidase